MRLYLLLAIFLMAGLSEAEDNLKTVSKELDSMEHKLKQQLNAIENASIIEDKIPSYKWDKVMWPTKKLPADAVLGGADSPYGCGMVYVGRAWYKGHLLPGKICGSDGRAFVAYNGTEIMLNESEVLRSRHVLWKPIKEGEFTNNAFQVGRTEDGEKLYTGRGFIRTLLTPGKVEGKTKALYMTYDQKVYTTLQYEILILG